MIEFKPAGLNTTILILPLPLIAGHTSDLKENQAPSCLCERTHKIVRGSMWPSASVDPLGVTSQNPVLKIGLILYAPDFLLEKRERHLSRH